MSRRPTRVPVAALAAISTAALLGVAGCREAARPQPTAEASYRRYCAACHGDSGRGDGPVAATLTTRPADLTALRSPTGGPPSEAQVLAAIDGRRAVAAHGPREMPVWGEVFAEGLADRPHQERTVLLQEQQIARYVGSLASGGAAAAGAPSPAAGH